jgi:hypothetical protein
MVYARLMLRRFEVGLNNFANPFLETLQPCKTKDILIGLIILLVAFAIFTSLSTEALINGDAAIYLQQMQNLNFTDRPVHLGYYLLGAGFIRLLPGSDDYAINLMNCFLGALSIMLVYFITFTICHKHILAIASSLLLLTNYMFIENSIYAEVYTPQVCFLLLSISLWLLNKPILASLSFLLSFLITPSAILALPCFFILRPRLRPLLLFCVIFAVSAAVAIFPVRQSYFFGSRGLFAAANRPLNLGWALSKEGREIFSSFFFCIPFVVAGLLEIFCRKQFRPLAFALLILWLVTLFSSEKIGDVSPQLPTYAMLCVVGGLGFHRLLGISGNKQYAVIMLSSLIAVVVLIKVTKTLEQAANFLPIWFLVTIISCSVLCMLVTILPNLRRIYPRTVIIGAVAFAIVTNGFVAFSRLIMVNRIRTEYRNTVMEIGRVASPGYVVVSGWTRGILLEHYLSQKFCTPYCWIDTLGLAGTIGAPERAEAYKKLRKAVAARRQIWLLGNHVVFFSALKRSGYEVTRFKMTQLKDVYVATTKD